MALLLCAKCGAHKPLPSHCGQPMKVQETGGKVRLVCWMGTSCGVQDLPEHCDVTMGVTEDDGT
jgi:hypothetical protein